MLPARRNLSMTCKLSRFLIPALLGFAAAPAIAPAYLATRAQAPTSTEVLPLSRVHPGMQGYAYTIFAGDQVEKFDLEVIGIMPNFLGPRQTIILVQLKGPKVEHTGVVAGMSGSPVYFEGKLAGALSLKLGVFTKEPIGGVTPIEDIIHPQPQISSESVPSQHPSQYESQFSNGVSGQQLPQDAASRSGLPTASALEPIETPLVFSGYQPEALRQFATQLESFGFIAAQGGTAAPKP